MDDLIGGLTIRYQKDEIKNGWLNNSCEGIGKSARKNHANEIGFRFKKFRSSAGR